MVLGLAAAPRDTGRAMAWRVCRDFRLKQLGATPELWCWGARGAWRGALYLHVARGSDRRNKTDGTQLWSLGHNWTQLTGCCRIESKSHHLDQEIDAIPENPIGRDAL